jgi:hypothetical protein
MEHLGRLTSPSHTVNEKAGRLETMIADLSRVVKILDVDIATEEEQSQIYDQTNAEYPMLARTIVARRENLKATISVLEAKLASMNTSAIAESPRPANLVLRRPRRNASRRRFEAWLRLRASPPSLSQT